VVRRAHDTEEHMTRAISRIRVEGFRSLRSVDLVPGRITVLIGPNGSGKSNLLSLLRMVALMRTASLRRFVGESGGASSLLHYGPKVTRELSVRIELEQDTGSHAYAARLGHAAADSLIFLDETVGYRPPGADSFQVVSLGAGHAESRLDDEAADPASQIARAVRWWLSQISFFHFHDTSATSALRQNARQEDARSLRSDGSNLAAYLRALATSDGENERKAWQRIHQLVRRVAPFLKELRPTLVAPAHPDTSAVRLDCIDERDETFGPHHLSDGTLRCIALFTALGQPADRLPAFIGIDEPELGLHPAALAVLAALIRSISHRCQVLLATQSPALLDLFEPGEVVVAERAAGETTMKRLEPDKLKAWLEDYSLSELYDGIATAPSSRLDEHPGL
jgi:predicted ATPase